MLDHSSKTSSSASEDFLSELLRGLRLDGVDYVRCELTAPWGISFPAQEAARFHFICGDCWLRVADGDWIELKRGDAVLLPRGGAHALASAPGEKLSPLEAYSVQEVCHLRLRRLRGRAGKTTILFCGSLRFQHGCHASVVAHDADVMPHRRPDGKRAGGSRTCSTPWRGKSAPAASAPAACLRGLADVLAALIIRPGWSTDAAIPMAGWRRSAIPGSAA